MYAAPTDCTIVAAYNLEGAYNFEYQECQTDKEVYCTVV